MLLQLWTSAKETLLLENQDGIHFFQILNRYALSVDSENLFAKGGMLLIKAITGSIVTHGRALVGATLPPIESRTPGTQAPPKAGERSSTDSKFNFYYRGGSVPFEMVSAFFILIYQSFIRCFEGRLLLSWKGFQISRFSGDNF
jgi:hypothetical protein